MDEAPIKLFAGFMAIGTGLGWLGLSRGSGWKLATLTPMLMLGRLVLTKARRIIKSHRNDVANVNE